MFKKLNRYIERHKSNAILEMKTKISEMKNTLNEIRGRLNSTEEITNELEDKVIEIT